MSQGRTTKIDKRDYALFDFQSKTNSHNVIQNKNVNWEGFGNTIFDSNTSINIKISIQISFTKLETIRSLCNIDGVSIQWAMINQFLLI